jgi:hypothetical protein
MVVVILLIVGVGVYFLVASSKSTTTTSLPVIQGNTMIPATTTTVSTLSTGSPSAHVISSPGASSVHVGSSSAASGITTYGGTFNFTIPEGPSGVRSMSNGSLQIYNTTQAASGSFSFFVDASNESGSGTGHGTLTATTSGFCSGSTTVRYTFIVPDATTILGGNLTVFFSDPVPGNFSVQLSCTGDMAGVSTTTNNPSPFLPVYPNEINVPTVPGTVSNKSGNFDYYIHVAQTG